MNKKRFTLLIIFVIYILLLCNKLSIKQQVVLTFKKKNQEVDMFVILFGINISIA